MVMALWTGARPAVCKPCNLTLSRRDTIKQMTVLIVLLLASAPVLAQPSGAGAMFARYDLDEDGAVDRAELDAARAALFDQADSNQNGVIDPDERAGLTQTLSGQVRQARGRMAGLMAERQLNTGAMFDANEDGQISRTEFLAAPTPRFDALDVNGDDRVNADELAPRGR